MTTSDQDQFGEPAPVGRPTRGALGDDRCPPDRWGRYVLPPSNGAKSIPMTRTSTVAKTMEDHYLLGLWDGRMVAKGVADNPDLISLAAGANVNDRATLNDVAARAKDRAGAHALRDHGTGLHGVLEQEEGLGRAVVVPTHLQPAHAAYAELRRKAGLLVMPGHVERIVCHPGRKVGGTIDRITLCSDGALRIADLKTGKTMDWSELYVSVQLAIYGICLAYGPGLWNKHTYQWEPLPPEHRVALDYAWIMHVPSMGSRAYLYKIQLDRAIKWAVQAFDVRQARKDAKGSLELVAQYDAPALTTPAPALLLAAIATANSRQEIAVLWDANQAAWTPECVSAADSRLVELDRLATLSVPSAP